MERLLAWYRVSSSTGAVVALIVANAIPLFGVLFLDWDVQTVLVLYWLENGVVGVVNVFKIARAAGPADADPASAAAPVGGPAAKATLIPFFVIHYGLFWLVHGMFVVGLPAFTGMFGRPATDGFGGFEGEFPSVVEPPGLLPVSESGGLEGGTLLLALAALVISHGLSFWWNFLRGGEYRRVTPQRQMFAPYGRLVALHVTIIVGAIAVIATGATAAAVAVLVTLKIALDLGLHLKEHRGVATTTT